MGTREEAGCHCIVELKGWDTPTGDQEQGGEMAYAHTHAQDHREMLSHRGKEESLSPTPRKSLSNACMHTHTAIAHSCTIIKDPVIQKHTHVHMCPVMQPSLLAMTITVTQANNQSYTSIHVYRRT